MMIMSKQWACAALVMVVLGLSACGNSHGNRPLYYWGNYPDAVYRGMQGKQSPDQQLAALEKYLAQAQSRNLAVAPGVYAQMGMLYAELGRAELAQKAFNEEKTRFPESAQFMDFLMKNKGAGK